MTDTVEKMGLENKRFFVKIEAGKAHGGNPCIYINKGFRFSQFMKWKWYFDYRAALYKVQHPRHHVQYMTGSYYVVPEKQELLKRVTDKITAAKRMITKYDNALSQAISTWDRLFPIEEEAFYRKGIAKRDSYICQLRTLEAEYSKLNQ